MERYNFRVLTLDDKAEIKKNIADFPNIDIYSDPRFLRVFQNYTGERALIFCYKGGGGKFILPFFERALGQNGFKDLFSPWYYGGPVHNFKDPSEAGKNFPDFLREFRNYCLSNGVVSEFQRLNPILENHRLYEFGGEGKEFRSVRKVVYLDLTQDKELIRKEYLYNVRKNIAKALRNGLTIVRQKDPNSIKQFFEVYTASLNRRGEKRSFYYFSPKFFTDLFESLRENIQLFTAYYHDQPISYALVIGQGDVLYDYLKPSKPEYLNLRSNDLMVDEIMIWAKKAGYKYYDLGGGLSDAEDDSLLKFKKGFSRLTKDFYMLKKIYNRPKYEDLCVKSGQEKSALIYESADFFPEYTR